MDDHHLFTEIVRHGANNRDIPRIHFAPPPLKICQNSFYNKIGRFVLGALVFNCQPEEVYQLVLYLGAFTGQGEFCQILRGEGGGFPRSFLGQTRVAVSSVPRNFIPGRDSSPIPGHTCAPIQESNHSRVISPIIPVLKLKV